MEPTYCFLKAQTAPMNRQISALVTTHFVLGFMLSFPWVAWTGIRYLLETMNISPLAAALILGTVFGSWKLLELKKVFTPSALFKVFIHISYALFVAYALTYQDTGLRSVLFYSQTDLNIILWVTVIGAGIVGCFQVKLELIRHYTPSYEFYPAEADQFEGINLQLLRRFSFHFEALGFVTKMDYTLRGTTHKLIPVFTRLFYHPEHHCFATLSQVIPEQGTATQISYGVVSYLDEGWTYTSVPNYWSIEDQIACRPKALWTSLLGAAPVELLNHHLEKRHQIAQNLSIQVLSDLTPFTFLAEQQNENFERRKVLGNKSMFLVPFEIDWFRRRSRLEWLGDYPKIATQRNQAAQSETSL